MPDPTKQGQGGADLDIPADVLAVVQRGCHRPFDAGLMHPFDAALHFERLTDLYWGVTHMMTCAAAEFTKSGDPDDAAGWFENAFPGDMFIGVPDDFRGIPGPDGMMLGMLERIETFCRDLVRCISHHYEWDERDLSRITTGLGWKVAALVRYGLLSERDAEAFREVVAKIVPAWATLKAREENS